jgi:hypothetical protein
MKIKKLSLGTIVTILTLIAIIGEFLLHYIFYPHPAGKVLETKVEIIEKHLGVIYKEIK